MVSNTSRQFNSFASSGERPGCGCIPTGVAFTIASKNSRRRRARATASPPTARASDFAFASRLAPHAHSRSRLRECECHGARRSSRSHDQHTAASQRHAPFKSTQHTNVIRIVPVEFPATTHHNRVDGPDSRRERIATIEMTDDALLMGQRHAEPSDTEPRYRPEKILQVAHKERQIDRIHAARRESRILHRRRKRMADRISDHAVDPRPPVNLDPRDKALSFPRARSGRAPWRFPPARKQTHLFSTQRQEARRQAHVAHRYGHDVSLLLREVEQLSALGQRIALRCDLDSVRLVAPAAPPRLRGRLFGMPPKEMRGRQLLALAQKNVEPVPADTAAASRSPGHTMRSRPE